MKRSIFILFSLCFFIFTPTLVNSQISQDSSDIVVSMYPETPTPNESVTVSIESYVANLNSAQITWRINGQTVKSGVGEKKHTFTTGNEGTSTAVAVTARTSDGNTLSTSFTLNPAYVDLFWESEGYTPPFYKGKALFSFQNRIRFIAMPRIRGTNGAEINPKNLVYTWKKDGSVMANDSGYGKNVYTFNPSVISRPFEISVEVSSPNSSRRGTARVSISPTDPTVRFYEKNPIYGIQFQKSLKDTVDIKDAKEIIIVGVPFYFGTTDPYQGLLYKWQINGVAIDSDFSQTARVFRTPEGSSGVSRISVSIEHINKILQLAKTNFDLKFDSNTTEQSSF